jgi:hypothetical protein
MNGRVNKGKPVAFDFVVEELFAVNPRVKPMFGCHAVYVNDKIVLILRNKEGVTNDNGVWIATTHEHHESLRKDFPSMRTISVFGGKESGWQNLPVDDESFEEAVMKVCKLIMRGDQRIGKTPKPRKKNTSSNLRH